MIRRAAILLLLFVPAPAADAPEVDGGRILRDLKWLADDDRQGREAGTKGALAAADFLARRAREIGLEPAAGKTGFFQEFTLPRGFEIRPETCLEASRGDKRTRIGLGRDLQPMSLSGPGDVTAPAAFAGYGIAAPELGYDDYAGFEAKGRVLIVLRGAPARDDRKSPFASPAAVRRYATFKAKADTAAGAGAAALVVVNDPRHSRKPKDDVAVHDAGGESGPIPVVHLSYRAGRKLAKACGLSLQREQNAIDRRLEPRSRALADVELRVEAALEARRLPVRNVCAILRAPRPGGGPSETLVLGAHFDHVGLGHFASRATSSKEKGHAIHNGADDNASGSAALLELGRWLVARRALLRRDVLFCWFTAEEMGLLGSRHYVGAPVVPLEQCVAMVNFDMVGRLKGSHLQIGGTGTSPVFPRLLEEVTRRHRLEARFNPGGKAPSDNTSFYDKGLPVLFFFTGLHKDYHRPSDDWNRIDRRGLERVIAIAADVCLDLATRPKRPPFSRSDGSGLSAGPYLGLGFEQRPEGVFVIHVEKKSPGSRARFRVGDRVEEYGGTPVRSLSQLNGLLFDSKPGSKVRIEVRRGPRLLALTVRLGKK